MDTGSRNFAESFCERRGIPRERFVDAALKQFLYPHALVMLPFNALGKNRLLASDREIIEDIGLARDSSAIADTLSRMQWYYGRQWPWRHTMRLRLSSRRIMKLARKTFAQTSLLREKVVSPKAA